MKASVPAIQAVRLLLLTLLVMLAFAGNSLLTRAALAESLIDPGSFALVRVLSGALVLVLLVAGQMLLGRKAFVLPRPNWAGVGGLSLYLIGFSAAYLSLDTGLGALILFAVVQLTMFAWAVLQAGSSVPAARWLGSAVALAGLVILLWPSQQGLQIGLVPVALMVVAALGWAAVSLAGLGSKDPLADMMANFVLSCIPVGAVWALWAVGAGEGARVSLSGVMLAAVSGAVTSALGYALWFWVLPSLGATRAAIWQLSVPVLAAAMGVLALGEVLSLRFVIAAVLVVCGVLIGLALGRTR